MEKLQPLRDNLSDFLPLAPRATSVWQAAPTRHCWEGTSKTLLKQQVEAAYEAIEKDAIETKERGTACKRDCRYTSLVAIINSSKDI